MLSITTAQVLRLVRYQAAAGGPDQPSMHPIPAGLYPEVFGESRHGKTRQEWKQVWAREDRSEMEEEAVTLQ